jgi:exo-beta-1,3-glucanase (GH17 family)
MNYFSVSRCAAIAFILVAFAMITPGRSQTASPESRDLSRNDKYAREEPFVNRPLHLFSNERWIGNAIAYGPYRDGQHPGGPIPGREELREDLHLMSEHWSLIRLYGAAGPTETILEVIREDSLDMKVMLGVWVDPEERLDDKGQVIKTLEVERAANRNEVESAVRLAAAYSDIVITVCVGNETQVFWSSHRSPPGLLIYYVREMRARTSVPVTTADDFNFWNKTESQAVANEVDYIVTHMHPLWNGIQLEAALEWTRKTYAEIQTAHPNHLVVLGETGWATQRHNVGEQAELMKGKTGEPEQKVFYDEVIAWVEKDRIPLFYFVAFDENWKGGEHPNEVEKHWGLYRADRTPKKALSAEK